MREIILALTGTPCTGKTTLAGEISKQMGFKAVHLNEFIKENRLCGRLDKRRNTRVIDPKKLSAAFRRKTFSEKKIVVEGVLSHLLPVTHIIVLRASPLLLEERMRKRKYSRRKIKENIEAELLGVQLYESLSRCRNVLEINATRKVNLSQVRKWLKTGGKKVMEVDWSTEFMKTLA